MFILVNHVINLRKFCKQFIEKYVNNSVISVNKEELDRLTSFVNNRADQSSTIQIEECSSNRIKLRDIINDIPQHSSEFETDFDEQWQTFRLNYESNYKQIFDL